MTKTRYFFWRIAQTFGVSLKQRHATNAAGEAHLLREAEEILGRLSWEDAEEIEELSVEYWNLRKLSKKYEDLYHKVSSANDNLQKSHDQRAELLGMVVDSTKDLVVDRERLIEKSGRLNAERDTVLAEARSVKRRHDGIKAKLEVLAGEGGTETDEVDASKVELLKLKKHFKGLRARRDSLAAKISTLNEEVEDIDTSIQSRRSDMRDEAFGSYQNIGRANRDISQTRAELGMLESEMVNLFSEIGRYFLANRKHPTVAKVASKNRSIISQMAALRASITLNNQLSGRELPAPTSKVSKE